AADITASSVHALHQRRNLARVRRPVAVPCRHVGDRHTEYTWTVAADHDRHAVRPGAARPQLALPHLVIPAFVIHLPGRQQTVDDRERFLEPGRAVVERVAEVAELRLVPTRP